MSKGNKSAFDALIETDVFEYTSKSGKQFIFEIKQLTLGDVADVSRCSEDDGEILLIARSLGWTEEETKKIPVPAVKKLVEVISEFNDLGDMSGQQED